MTRPMASHTTSRIHDKNYKKNQKKKYHRELPPIGTYGTSLMYDNLGIYIQHFA